MTLLFFLLAIFYGWLAYNLFVPVLYQPRAAVASFLAGWLVGEMAPHHILLQMLLVALFVWGGAVTGLLGAVGFLICVAAWLAMAYHYLSSDRAEAEVENALLDGLGEDYLSRIDDDLVNQFPEGPDFELIRWPFRSHHPGVEVIKDLEFGQYRRTLDIYRGTTPLAGAPVLLQIHGGAWTQNMGSKNEQALPLMRHMARRGWVCVSTDYRLSPRATFPEHIVDCKQALVWIREHISAYGGDPDFVVVTGGSAGGHLSALMALSQNDPAFQPGFEDADTRVAGAVPFYGVYDYTDENQLAYSRGLRTLLETSVMKVPLVGNEERYRQASPLHRVTAAAPPFMVIQGDADSLVPVAEGRVFAERLQQLSNNPVVYAEISGAQHAFDMIPSLRSEYVKHGVERFLAYLYSAHRVNRNKETAA